MLLHKSTQLTKSQRRGTRLPSIIDNLLCFDKVYLFARQSEYVCVRVCLCVRQREREGERERARERERLSSATLLLKCLQHWARLGHSEGQQTPFRSALWIAGTHVLEPQSIVSQTCLQEAEPKLGVKLIPRFPIKVSDLLSDSLPFHNNHLINTFIFIFVFIYMNIYNIIKFLTIYLCVYVCLCICLPGPTLLVAGIRSLSWLLNPGTLIWMWAS